MDPPRNGHSLAATTGTDPDPTGCLVATPWRMARGRCPPKRRPREQWEVRLRRRSAAFNTGDTGPPSASFTPAEAFPLLPSSSDRSSRTSRSTDAHRVHPRSAATESVLSLSLSPCRPRRSSCMSSQQRQAPRCSPIPSPAGWVPPGWHMPGIACRGAGACGAEQPAGWGRSAASRW